MPRLTDLLGLFVTASLLSLRCNAIGQATCVSFSPSSSAFSVFSRGDAAPILTSSDDWPGVHRAASDFQADIQRVTGSNPSIANVTSSSKFSSSPPIIVGTLGKSSIISQIVNNTKLDVSSINGKWEAFMGRVVQHPLPGVKSAYVIIGADKRGTIFGMYDLSEQFGVSPWWWWADVPTTKQSNLFISTSGCSHGSPTVKYRGIFLNDEQPALTNWALEKFTNGTGSLLLDSPFNHQFYTKLYELILRLKGNYLWPAQWNSAFSVDDTLNQPLADFYGVVMGTSHEEPMARSIPAEWGLFGKGDWNYGTNSEFIYQFWVNGTIRAKPYETLFTVGMRGDGDLPMENSNIDILEKVVADQQQIFMDVFNETNITSIPRVWALYSEVEGYYEDGLRVPDDVILLWTDDNYGNVRRFPTAAERNRTGGAGVYYHVDYVGPPRCYKWISTSQIPRMHEQMSLAVDREATQIWILNVGDLKPYEREIEFFLTLGWNSSVWNPNNLDTYVTSWAQREFDLSHADALSVTEIIANMTRWNNRRKPELLNSTTFSLTNYREADAVLAGWQTLNESSWKIYNKLPAATKPAFFQMVHHPVQASSNLGTMLIAAGLNNLRVSQARVSANELVTMVDSLFEKDYDLEHEYHSLLDGKWDHMMDQTHVGYYYWQQPMANTMPAVSKVQARKEALPGPMRITPEGTLAAWPGDNLNQCSAGYNCPFPVMTLDPFNSFGNRYIDVGLGGPNSFTFTATSNVSWLKASPSRGTISPSNPEQRVFVEVSDWNSIDNSGVGAITFQPSTPGKATAGQTFTVPVTFVVNRTSIPSSFKGFVEGDGYISIEAAHASRNTSVAGITWTELPGIGRTVSGITPWPRTGNDGNNFTAGAGPSIEYDFYTFNSNNGTVSVSALVSPSLNGQGPDRPMAFALQVDTQEPQTKYYVPASAPGELPAEWGDVNGFAANSIFNSTSTFQASPGAHTLKIWMVEPAVIVQKVIINTGGLRQSYLGPPESVRV